MSENTVFLYSGYMMTHHQVLDKNKVKEAKFINLASYGNKRLYHNMLKSMKRELKFE